MAFQPKDLPLTLGMKITTSILGQKYDVFVRGWFIGRYIITESPLVNGEPPRLAPNTGCEVHFIKEGDYFTFKTSVMCVYPQIVTLMIIEFPRTVETYSLRKNKRMRVNYPVEFTYSEAKKAFTEYGILRDLSLTGALITHKKVLLKDTKLILKANLSSGLLSSQEALVQNVRHNPKSETETYVTGIKFLVVNETNKSILQKYMEDQLAAAQKA